MFGAFSSWSRQLSQFLLNLGIIEQLVLEVWNLSDTPSYIIHDWYQTDVVKSWWSMKWQCFLHHKLLVPFPCGHPFQPISLQLWGACWRVETASVTWGMLLDLLDHFFLRILADVFFNGLTNRFGRSKLLKQSERFHEIFAIGLRRFCSGTSTGGASQPRTCLRSKFWLDMSTIPWVFIPSDPFGSQTWKTWTSPIFYI